MSIKRSNGCFYPIRIKQRHTDKENWAEDEQLERKESGTQYIALFGARKASTFTEICLLVCSQGMPSIVDIFKNYNATPPSKQETQEDSTVSSASKRAKLSSSSHNSQVNQEVEESRETDWGYKTDEIDQSVFDELPVEIQRELRSFLRTNKQFNTGKSKGDGSTSSIAHYFPPLNR